MNDTLSYEEYTNKSLLVRGSEEKYGSVLKTLGARRHNKVKNGPPGWLISKDKEEQLKKLIEGVSIQEVSVNETKSIVSKRMGKTKMETVPENTTNLEDIEKNIKSRKGQKKYHRAVSNKESDDETQITVKNIDTKNQSHENPVETSKIEETTRPTRKPSIKDNKPKDTKSSQKPPKDSIEEKELLQRKKEEVERFEKEKREHERRKDSSRNVEVEKRRVKERRRKETPDKRHKEIYISSSDSVSSSSSSGSPSSDSSSDGFPEPRSPKRNKDKDYDELLKKVNTLQKKLMKMDIKTHRRD